MLLRRAPAAGSDIKFEGDAAARPAKTPRRTRSTEAAAAAAAAATAELPALEGASEAAESSPPRRTCSNIHAALAPSARRRPEPMSARRVPEEVRSDDEEEVEEEDDREEEESREDGAKVKKETIKAEENKDGAMEDSQDTAATELAPAAATAAAAGSAVRLSTRARNSPASYAPAPTRGPNAAVSWSTLDFPTSSPLQPVVASTRLPSVECASADVTLHVFDRAGFHYLQWIKLFELMREQGLLPSDEPPKPRDARTRRDVAGLSAPMRWLYWLRDWGALSFPSSSTVRSHDAVVLSSGAAYLSAHALAHLLLLMPQLSRVARKELKDEITEFNEIARVVIHKEPMWGVAS